MKHIVIGGGQIGTAIAQVLKDDPDNEVTVYDVKDDTPCLPEKMDVMHVCIPYTHEFRESVIGYRWAYSPDLIIIHSTVPVGTSRRLRAVHSPVTGVHPFLYESIKKFTKWFGGDRADEASEIFLKCYVPIDTAPDQETTEAGKLWQTLQYGYLIALQKEGYRWMMGKGADPIIAYNWFNLDYTDGYTELNLGYSLPILKDMPGPIGGHCVIPNLALTGGPMAEFLETLNEQYKLDDSSVGSADPEQARITATSV